jgi:hypothetical protein
VISTNAPRIGHMPQSGNVRAAMGRNLPTCNAVITFIGSAGLYHCDEKSPEVSTIIKDGGICDFHNVSQHWQPGNVWTNAEHL